MAKEADLKSTYCFCAHMHEINKNLFTENHLRIPKKAGCCVGGVAVLAGLNSPYARHTGVRGLPVPLWRFGISLLFAVVVCGEVLYSHVLLDNDDLRGGVCPRPNPSAPCLAFSSSCQAGRRCKSAPRFLPCKFRALCQATRHGRVTSCA